MVEGKEGQSVASGSVKDSKKAKVRPGFMLPSGEKTTARLSPKQECKTKVVK